MSFCGWIVLGGLAGWIASMIAGNNARQGLIGNVVVGIIGSFVGGMVFNFFGGVGVTGFNLYSFGVALVGAVITLAVKKMIFGRA
ncbi:MAG: GlsB/YeaQ/YmgE family stress response membrane protein [Archangium sp.]